LKIKESEPDLDKWKNFLHKLKNPTHQINIGLVGKYVELNDSYKSILESLIHAGTENEVKVNVKSIHSEYLDKENINKELIDLDGIIVAPKNVILETELDILKHARQIYINSAISHAMPPANLASMETNERLLIAQWYQKNIR